MAIEDAGLVWHYTDGGALMNILEKNELWAGSAAFMNDMNELLSGSIQLRNHFEEQLPDLSKDATQMLEKYIPEVKARSRDSFVLSASSDPDSLTMWRYYGRHQVSFAVGLDRNESLVPLARLKGEEHPNPPAGYEDDAFDYDEEGNRFRVYDPDGVFIEGGDWKPVVYDLKRQSEIITKVFETLRDGVEKRLTPAEEGKLRVWLFPFFMNEDLDLIKNEGFRDEREERIIVWPNPAWKFVFHRPGAYGLVPYVKLTSLQGENIDPEENRFATKAGRLPIREIRIGPTPYSVEATASLEQLLEFHGLHDVKVTCSEIPFRQ
ncbi:hypothetical protein [Paenarthrobacter histidinolovorans]|uniref:hypothetical protein n=1 Tax=Paenarthrobacter histidinolovorans TaxID=43664 RepID=UPI001667013F|nr:hypothetical protein [Paenarthrobacter histidinolovorans]GGJ21457.1 hypothetical protein GCM10010052_18340 [Paenarthrobacter histidinolovorans]